MMSALYTYNIYTGHYDVVPLNEAENIASDNDVNNGAKESEENKETPVEEQPKQSAGTKSVNQDSKVQQLNNDINIARSRYENDIKAIDMQIIAAQKAVSAEMSKPEYVATSDYNPTEVDSKILDLEKRKQDRTFRYQQEVNQKTQALIAYKASLAKQLTVEKTNSDMQKYNIPQKYYNYVYLLNEAKLFDLNESKISQAKIYITELVGGQDNVLKNTADFKKIFRTTDMLYGKDKNGYYVVCVDAEDFENLYDVFEYLGYSRRDVESIVLPQLYSKRY